MIQTELLRDGTLIRHYSDEKKLLRQNETDALYADPVDIYPCPYTYTETDMYIDGDEEISGEELLQLMKEVL